MTAGGAGRGSHLLIASRLHNDSSLAKLSPLPLLETGGGACGATNSHPSPHFVHIPQKQRALHSDLSPTSGVPFISTHCSLHSVPHTQCPLLTYVNLSPHLYYSTMKYLSLIPCPYSAIHVESIPKYHGQENCTSPPQFRTYYRPP